jgi:hypothetical protein
MEKDKTFNSLERPLDKTVENERSQIGLVDDNYYGRNRTLETIADDSDRPLKKKTTIKKQNQEPDDSALRAER